MLRMAYKNRALLSMHSPRLRSLISDPFSFASMHFLSIIAAVAATLRLTHGLNILVNNDDGFGASNIRELYRLLRAAGHNAWMVAPATDQSGQGGRLVFATTPNLTAPAQFNLIPSGAPSLGRDPNDSHIWYYNGTPAACTLVGLDIVLPTYANITTPDLLVSGPNFGNNIGTFAFTGSGTIGASYTAVERNIPAIAFSAANLVAQSYRDLTNQSTQATIAAGLAVQLVNRLAANTPAGQRILPLGYGMNVNFPTLNSTCMNPPYVESRITGGAGLPTVAYNVSSGLVVIPNNNYYATIAPGANQCYNGDCSLPGESVVVQSCRSSVSMFTVDYDAPTNVATRIVRAEAGFVDRFFNAL